MESGFTKGKGNWTAGRILLKPIQEFILPILRNGGQTSIPETE
jgi:hypothetical protein